MCQQFWRSLKSCWDSSQELSALLMHLAANRSFSLKPLKSSWNWIRIHHARIHYPFYCSRRILHCAPVLWQKQNSLCSWIGNLGLIKKGDRVHAHCFSLIICLLLNSKTHLCCFFPTGCSCKQENCSINLFLEKVKHCVFLCFQQWSLCCSLFSVHYAFSCVTVAVQISMGLLRWWWFRNSAKI